MLGENNQGIYTNTKEVYDKIYELTFFWLRRYKKLSTADEADEVAHIMSMDLFMKIYNGGEIHSWLGYISLSYMGTIKYWRKLNKSELIDATNNDDLKEGIIRMSSSMNGCTSKEFEDFADLEYLESIPRVIDSILEESKYREFTKEWTNTKLSIMLSFVKGEGENLVYYHLDEGEQAYMKMIMSKVKQKLAKELSSARNADLDMTLLQLYTMEGADGDE